MMMGKVCDSSRFGVTGGDQISFGQVKFEMPIKHLHGDVEQEVEYMSLDFRAKNQAGDVNLRDISTQILFKVRDWLTVTHRENGNREGKYLRPSSGTNRDHQDEEKPGRETKMILSSIFNKMKLKKYINFRLSNLFYHEQLKIITLKY